MFDDKRFLINSIDQVQSDPYNTVEGKENPKAFSNYVAIVAAVKALYNEGVGFNLNGLDPEAIRREFRVSKNLPVEFHESPIGLHVLEPEGLQEKQLKPIVLTIGDAYKIRIVKTTNQTGDNDSNNLYEKITISTSVRNQDGSRMVTKTTIPYVISSKNSGELMGGTSDAVLYEEQSLADGHYDFSKEEENADPFDALCEHMRIREIDPDKSEHREISSSELASGKSFTSLARENFEWQVEWQLNRTRLIQQNIFESRRK